MFATLLGTAALAGNGLTLTRYDNTALAGTGTAQLQASLESITDCEGATCGTASSLLLEGRVAPAFPGKFGFNVSFDPPLPYPSPEAYARLWVNDHLLYPVSSGMAVGRGERTAHPGTMRGRARPRRTKGRNLR